ncbi:MAG: hypothetical protein NTY09_05005 [bacterium]|nr:hypothetical protein [bacterium]
MLFNEIYGIENEIPLPWWIGRNPLLEWLVFNPIFQLHMKKKYKPPIVNELRGLIAGILYFVAIYIVFKINNDDPEVGPRIFIGLFLVPTAVLIITGYLRTIAVCLASAPREIRREIESMRMMAISTTPISDAGIYFSNAYQILFRAMGAYIGILTFLITLGIPSMIVVTVNGWNPNELFYLEQAPKFMTYFQIVVIFSYCTVYLYLTCFAGTMYGINMAAFPAMIATVAHVALIFLFTTILFLISIIRMGGEFMHPHYTGWDIILLEGFNLLLLLLITWLTGRLGVIFFARYRRPGFFEPEFASASGL